MGHRTNSLLHWPTGSNPHISESTTKRQENDRLKRLFHYEEENKAASHSGLNSTSKHQKYENYNGK